MEFGRWKMAKIESFEQLEVWQLSQAWAVRIYATTKSFPRDEAFGITSQIRRSAASISANIAEGFGRQSPRDKLHFYVIAYGSTLETKNFLYLSQKLGYVQDESLNDLLETGTSVQKMVNAFMRPLKA
jgi:four helix bundle protein